MSTLGSLLAGLAVAVGGVWLGRKLEQLNTDLRDRHDIPGTKGQDNDKVIEAERDPQTGVYHHKK